MPPTHPLINFFAWMASIYLRYDVHLGYINYPITLLAPLLLHLRLFYYWHDGGTSGSFRRMSGGEAEKRRWVSSISFMAIVISLSLFIRQIYRLLILNVNWKTFLQLFRQLVLWTSQDSVPCQRIVHQIRWHQWGRIHSTIVLLTTSTTPHLHLLMQMKNV